MQNPFAPSSRSLGSHGPPDFVTKVCLNGNPDGVWKEAANMCSW
jgi:hypothetical protein